MRGLLVGSWSAWYLAQRDARAKAHATGMRHKVIGTQTGPFTTWRVFELPEPVKS